ncbi:uncharacterized protein J3R85_019740, partial [Psidium guajava]
AAAPSPSPAHGRPPRRRRPRAAPTSAQAQARRIGATWAKQAHPRGPTSGPSQDLTRTSLHDPERTSMPPEGSRARPTRRTGSGLRRVSSGREVGRPAQQRGRILRGAGAGSAWWSGSRVGSSCPSQRTRLYQTLPIHPGRTQVGRADPCHTVRASCCRVFPWQ